MKQIKKQYYQAFKTAAEKNGMTAMDLARLEGKTSMPAVYRKLKESNPNGLIRAIEPFTKVGATVEVVVTCVDGSRVVIK